MYRGESVHTFIMEVMYLGSHGEVPWPFWCMSSSTTIGLSTHAGEEDLGFIVVL